MPDMGIEFIEFYKDKIKIEDEIKSDTFIEKIYAEINVKIRKVRNSHVLLELFYRRHFQRKLKPCLEFTDICF